MIQRHERGHNVPSSIMQNRIPCILAVALLTFFLASSASKAQSASPPKILFEVMGEEKGKIPAASTIEPIALIENGHFKKPPEYDYGDQKKSDASYDLFEKEFFRRGRKYPLYIGGTEKGFVTVGEPVGESCISLSATVTASVRLSNAQLALAATEQGVLKSHPDWRQPVTSQQRAEFSRLVTESLATKKIGSIPSSQIKIEEIRSTKLNANAPPALIGRATVKLRTGIHHIFIAATLKGAKYEKVLWSYHFARDEDDASAQSESLVEQIDLDGDGTDEIITINTYYESWDYNIYKEENGTWKKVYQGGGGGC